MLHTYLYHQPFELESGEKLENLTIAYTTYGRMNAAKDNVIWICHALTANADPEEWWPGFVGKGLPVDTDKYFVVCANILGSCYGTTGPLSPMQGNTAELYYSRFPFITIRDMVHAHRLLADFLEIDRIRVLIGGSMGGYQALEWALTEKQRIQKLFLLATGAAESTWGRAIHTAQRMAIEADPTWKAADRHAGAAGLKAARGIGMLTYRNYHLLQLQQSDADPDKTDAFKVSSYIHYQGDKLVKRFHAFSYWQLTRAMDSHNIARNRAAKPEEVLATIRMPVLVIGITSDLLCPLEEQLFLSEHIPGATFAAIDSEYGHDGFLIEFQKIGVCFLEWLAQQK